MGRYYPNGEFLTAGCPPGASPTWCTIMKGRDMLCRGLIRRVGNGRTTEVWHDQWVEVTGSIRSMGALAENSIHLVSDIIDPITNQWDVKLIHRVFNPPHLHGILGMPRPRRAGEDNWALACEKSGIFSVQSAYRNTMDMQYQGSLTVGSSEDGETKWCALWKLNALPKIIVFWWRVLKGLLPCYGELQRRHIKTLANCLKSILVHGHKTCWATVLSLRMTLL